LEESLANIVALDIGEPTTHCYSNVSDNPIYTFPGQDARRKVKTTNQKNPNVSKVFSCVEGKYRFSYKVRNLMELERCRDGRMITDLNCY